jgi:hypothetical protein
MHVRARSYGIRKLGTAMSVVSGAAVAATAVLSAAGMRGGDAFGCVKQLQASLPPPTDRHPP